MIHDRLSLDCVQSNRRFTVLSIAGIGAGTFVIHLTHLLSELDELAAVAIGVVPLILVSLALVGGSYWLWKSDLQDRYHPLVLTWLGGGAIVIAGLGISVMAYQAAHGTPWTDPLYLVVNWASSGAFGGFLIGVYDARRRELLDMIATERDTLESREQQLERKNERLERFASIVSHDLRNPLNVALGHAEMLQKVSSSDDRVETITEALDRMNAIIDDVLTLVREGGTVDDGDLEPVNLAEYANSCWGMVETGSAELHIDGHATIYADPSRLRQVFENLFRNAVEHGGEDVTVHVGLDTNGDARLYVEDDGPGIDSEHDADIFEPGYTTTDAGTGLGLAIIREIVNAHGWSIAVEQGELGGARFEINNVELAR